MTSVSLFNLIIGVEELLVGYVVLCFKVLNGNYFKNF